MEKKLEQDLKNNTVINAKTLLEKRGLIEKRLNRKVEMETPIGVFRFRVPTVDDIKDVFDFELDGQDYEDQMLVYLCAEEPSLKDQDVQKGFDNENNNPVEIVDKVFLPGEIQTIANKLIAEAGYKKDLIKVREEVKN